MTSLLFVALGGALGAAGRYGLSLLPWKGAFPLLTLLTNFLGAVAIGFLSGLFSQRLLGERGKLFWQTGVCGGFTTFSSFALETGDLLKSGHTAAALLYAAASLVLGVAAVFAGEAVVR